MKNLLNLLNSDYSLIVSESVENIQRMIQHFGIDRTEFIIKLMDENEVEELFAVDCVDFHKSLFDFIEYNVKAETIIEHKINVSFLYTIKDGIEDRFMFTKDIGILRYDSTMGTTFDIYDDKKAEKENHGYVKLNGSRTFRANLKEDYSAYDFSNMLQVVIELNEYIRKNGEI